MMYTSFEKHPLISRIVGLLRDKHSPPSSFRKNLFKLGQYLAYEISTILPTNSKPVESPLGTSSYLEVSDNLVIATVLRAALPMAEGVLDEFPNAKFGFLSASRDETSQQEDQSFTIIQNYIKMPESNGKIVIIVDPMLATGSTLIKVIEEIKASNPKEIIVLSAIASQFGIDKVNSLYPDLHVYAGAIDPTLNEKGYIVPGLGDAGDRAFNTPQKTLKSHVFSQKLF